MAEKSPKTKKTKKSKFPKVKLSMKKVYIMTAAICSVCILSLFLSVILSSVNDDEAVQPVVTAEPKTQDPVNFAELAPQEPRLNVSDEMSKKVDNIPAAEPELDKVSNKLADKPKVSKSEIVLLPAEKSAVTSAKDEPVAEVLPTVQKSAHSVENVKSEQKKESKQDSLKIADSVKKSETPKVAESVKKTEPQKKIVQTEKVADSAKKNVATEKKSTAAKPVASAKTASGSAKTAEPVKSKESSALLAMVEPPIKTEKVQEQVKKSPFSIPAAKNGATIVIVIDDAGRSAANTKMYTSLPFPVTIAVLPGLPETKKCAEVVRKSGQEMILHQPMQATNLSLDPGPGAVRNDMSSYEIASVLKKNLAELGSGVKGMNNHEGSLITSNVIKIGAVLDVCDEAGIYFLDSRTTAQTKAPQAALERDMTIFEKAGPYLDNELDREKMIQRMYETLAYANAHGHAIVIGHVDKSVKILPSLLSEMYPYIKAAGYRFATPSTLNLAK